MQQPSYLLNAKDVAQMLGGMIDEEKNPEVLEALKKAGRNVLGLVEDNQPWMAPYRAKFDMPEPEEPKQELGPELEQEVLPPDVAA